MADNNVGTSRTRRIISAALHAYEESDSEPFPGSSDDDYEPTDNSDMAGDPVVGE